MGVVGGALILDSIGPLPIISFVLDDGEPWRFIPPSSYNNTLNNVLYFSGMFPDGQHTVNFTVTGPGSPYIVDYFLIQQSDNDTAVASSSASASSSTLPQQTIVTTVLIAPTGLPSSGDGSGNTKSDSIVGPILGGVLGGIALLIGALVAFYFLYWKRRHKGRPYYYTRANGTDLLEAGACPARNLCLVCVGLTVSRWTENVKPAPNNFTSPLTSSTSVQPIPHPTRSGTASIEPYAPSPSTSEFRYLQEQVVLYPPRPQSEYSSGLGSPVPFVRQSTIDTATSPDPSANITPIVSRASVLPLGMTPAQRKAAEARANVGTRPLAIRQHTDSGQRFQRTENGGQGAGPSGSTEPPVQRGNLVMELPPAYSEE